MSRSSPYLNNLLDLLPDAVLACNGSGRVIGANPEACKLFGYPEVEILNANRNLLFQAIGKEIFGIRKNGQAFAAELSERTHYPARDQVISVRDITQRRKTEVELLKAQEDLRRARDELERRVEERTHQLLQSQSRLQRLVDSNIIGVIVSDINGGLFEANDAYLKLIGYDRKALESGEVDWTEITPPEYLDLEKQKTKEMMEFGSCTPYEKEYIRPDGTRVPVLIGYAKVDPSLDKAICWVVDLTERKKIENDLKRALAARDEFLSIASHELKTPITSMKLHTQIVHRNLSKAVAGTAEEVQVGELATTLTGQIDRMSKLIEDMLDISRIERGRLLLNKTEFDLGELVHESLGRFAVQFEAAGCKIDSIIEKGLTGNWDRDRLEQVVTNLISNAIKYGKGSPIHVFLVRENLVAKLRVKDSGIGVAEQDQKRIFDRFERAVAPGAFAGMGLGLYIVQQILAAHGGRISISSRLGEGSVFTADFPLSDA